MSSCTFFVAVFHGKASKQPPTSKNMKRLAKRNKQRRSKICVTDILVCSFLGPSPLLLLTLHAVAEEFNKYLSYVRNLGFEDTPDYDYLRDLFTQALKNIGDVEDGDYDWMKLNGGKGWENMKQHPSQLLHAANAVPNAASTRPLGGGADTPRGPQSGLTPARLNAAQPLPPGPAKPGVGKMRDRPGVSGGALPKRQSGVAGGLADVGTPTASTQAQFVSSTANLPQRMSQLNPAMSQQTPTQQNSRQQGTEQPPTTLQKIMKVLCCSR